MTTINDQNKASPLFSQTTASFSSSTTTKDGVTITSTSAYASFAIAGDGFELASTRFGPLASLFDPNAASGYSLNPYAPNFAENMARRFDPSVFVAWDAIAAQMTAFVQQFMQAVMQQLQGVTPGGGDAAVGPPTVGPQDVGEGTTPSAIAGYDPTYMQGEELFGEDARGVEGPRASDVEQGAEIGDCYFLSTLAGLATNEPGIIRDNISERTDPATGRKVYDVTFYEDDGQGGSRPRVITVNSDILRDEDGIEAYAQTHDNDGDGKDEMWVAIYEKAYAMYRSETGSVDQGYETVGQGGLGDEAYFALTGRHAELCDPRVTSESELADVLMGANVGETVLLGTICSDDPLIADGLPSGHMYTVLGCERDPATGEVMVTLRNPWGYYEPGVVINRDGTMSAGPGFDGANDGIFRLPLSEVQEYFDLATYPEDSTNKATKLRMNAAGMRA